MLQLFQRVFQKPINFAHAVLNPPQHLRPCACGDSLDECLRKLERKANLPIGDLYIKGESMKVASWPLGLRSQSHPVWSKTSDAWEASVSKQGYISGHVLEAEDKIGDLPSFFGTLHISKNCPGVYRDNVCTTCGDRDE